jgi:hypothetical protein
MTIQTTATATAVSALTVGTASAAIRVYLVATRLSDYGQLYQVRLHDGKTGRIIAHGTLDPEHAACRSLLRLGYSGYLEIWSEDGAILRSIIKDIAKSAGIRVCDDPKEGLRVRKLPMAADNDNGLPAAIAS